jgi:hypothetical protein
MVQGKTYRDVTYRNGTLLSRKTRFYGRTLSTFGKILLSAEGTTAAVENSVVTKMLHFEICEGFMKYL